MKTTPLLVVLLGLALSATPLRAQPAEVNRVLRTFDFEERRLGNVEDLPMHWVKVEGPGLPHYVNGRLTTDLAHAGQYSFRLDLDGGGILYRHAPTQIGILTGAHYRIEGYCHTTVLPHARARMTAYLADETGRPIPGTTRHSELYAARAADEPWHKLSIELSADSPRAAFLVLELGLLQPAQYAPQALGQRTLNVQDVRGTAWFDDITVSQVPRVTMTTGRPGNIFRRSDPVRLQVRVDDRFTEDLSARVAVRDAAGRVVYQRSGAIDLAGVRSSSPGHTRLTVEVPRLPAGWFEASLLIASRAQQLGTRTLAFIQLADDAPPGRPDGRFGFVATDLSFDGWDELPKLLPLLSAGRVKLSLWGPAGDVQESGPAALDDLIAQLQSLGITPTACLLDLPPELAAKLRAAEARAKGPDAGWDAAPPPAAAGSLASSSTASGHPSDWPLLLKTDPSEWRPQLAYMIARHANHLDRWQLGDDDSDAFVTDPAMRKVYRLVYNEFARLVQNPPDLAMPWPAWYELQGELPATVALSVPPAVVLPSQIPLYTQEMHGHEGHNLSLSIRPLERDRYGREEQIRDLAERVIYALSADVRRIDLPLPFTARREAVGPEVLIPPAVTNTDAKPNADIATRADAGSGTAPATTTRPANAAADGIIVKEPQELLLVLRTLITTLDGAICRGRIPIAEGVEAFLFDRDGEGIVVLWDRGGQTSVRELALNLGERPVRIDLWGNATPLLRKAADRVEGKELAAGEVKLSLGPMPVFLVDVDGQLAQTRASVAIDRPLVESSLQPHVRRVRFTNGYRETVTGTMRLRPPRGWTVNPPAVQFTLNPGETFEREVSIEIPFNSVAGPHTIAADFQLQAERAATFSVPIGLTLGLSDVGMQTLALRDGKDVVVQQMITNYGDRPIDYSAFAVVVGQARQERLVSALPAGKTTIKRYRFPNIEVKPGQRVRAGIKELAGTRILNDEAPVQ
jgi:hypothetical protein